MLRISVRALFVLALLLVLSGCATNHMTPVTADKQTKGPEEGKALVVFLRPSGFGGAIQSVLYDGDDYIGTLSSQKRIAYQADPGKHMFMVIGESADFMEAELLPNRTYYTVVVPRVGVWKARFSFRPQNGQIDENEVQSWLNASEEVMPNAEGVAWSKENQAESMQMKAEYLPKWMSKPEADQQRLHAPSGI